MRRGGDGQFGTPQKKLPSKSLALLGLKFLDENKLVKYISLLLFNIKLINPTQNYSIIIESNLCILKIFAIIFLLPMSFLSLLGYVQH